MSFRESLAYKNCAGRAGRSAALIVLAFLLSFSILAGSLTLTGLKSGLESLDARLGADIMVVPYEVSTENYLEDAILMGNSGYYYMSGSILDQVTEKIEGIEKISAQLYLVTTTASCCSTKVSIVGFDPETDFTVTPWAESTYSGTLGVGEVLVGCDLAAYAGDVLKFYDVDVTVAARLEETGTYLDTAVYTNMDTVRILIEAAKEKNIVSNLNNIDPDTMISSILIKTKEGCSAADVAADIKSSMRHVAVVKTETSVENVSDKLSGIQSLAGMLTAVVWVLIFVIELIAFNMSFGSRMKEFAVLRVLGISKKGLKKMLAEEAALVIGAGSIGGALISLLAMVLFSGSIQNSLDMPFLLPDAAILAAVTVCVMLVSAAAGILAAILAALKAGKIDAALILRGES